MLELLDHLRANEFKLFIVSGGGIEFIRQFSETAYGIPREDVIGSSLRYEFRETDSGSEIYRLPELGSFDDKEVKPANIQLHIGRRPILAVGNSDGDIQMMQYGTDGSGLRLALLLHHDDAEREYDYDHGTERALEIAAERGWTVVSVRDDFQLDRGERARRFSARVPLRRIGQSLSAGRGPNEVQPVGGFDVSIATIGSHPSVSNRSAAVHLPRLHQGRTDPGSRLRR
jgi:hypothetical protein